MLFLLSLGRFLKWSGDYVADLGGAMTECALHWIDRKDAR